METLGEQLLLTTYDEHVLCSKSLTEVNIDLSGLQPCNHEEADSRMALHAANAFRQGKKAVMIYATDADVLVISVALATLLNSVHCGWHMAIPIG